MRTRSRAQVAAIRANGRRSPKLGKRGDVVTPAALKAAGYFVPPLWKRATDSYNLRAYYALKPETYFQGFQGQRFVETPRAPISSGAARANDEAIRKLEDEILARRASGS